MGEVAATTWRDRFWRWVVRWLVRQTAKVGPPARRGVPGNPFKMTQEEIRVRNEAPPAGLRRASDNGRTAP